MAISKLILNGVTQMDVTGNTSAAGNMLSGTTGTKNDGTTVTGNIATKTSSDMTVSGSTVTAPAGYYSSSASKAVANGSVTMPASIDGGNTSISISSGKITLSKSVSATPSVTTAGYVSSGTAGNTTISLSATASSVGATTYTPTTSQQTIINAGTYVYGTQKIDAMPTGTAGTPTATKGTVSNHSVSITPSVTNTTGYITGSTINGTAVSVSASELVSGTLSIAQNGTGIDVTNYAAVDVAVPTTPASLVPDAAWSDYKTHIGYYFDDDSPVSAYTVYLGVRPSTANGTTIDWGDNNTTTTNSTSYTIYSHTYSAPSNDGYYMITLTASSGTFTFNTSNSSSEDSNRAFGNVGDSKYLANGTRFRWVVFGDGFNFSDYQTSIFQACAGLEEAWYQRSTKLTSAYFPRYFTFADCPKLRCVKVKTPNNFTFRSFGGSAFLNCKSLEEFDFSAMTSAGSRSWSQNLFKDCWNLKTAKGTSGGAWSVNDRAFYNCYSLESFTFATTSSVTISSEAFYNCSSLGEIHFQATTAPTVDNSNAWTGVPTSCKIYVPTGYLSAYTSATNMPDPNTYTYIEE